MNQIFLYVIQTKTTHTADTAACGASCGFVFTPRGETLREICFPHDPLLSFLVIVHQLNCFRGVTEQSVVELCFCLGRERTASAQCAVVRSM